MADRVSASIAIGGISPRSLLGELARTIHDEDARLDWEGEPFAVDAIPTDARLELQGAQGPLEFLRAP